MKVLELSHIKREKQINRTIDERKMIVNINHEFIVKMYYCFIRKN